jgi:hypothetical protein
MRERAFKVVKGWNSRQYIWGIYLSTKYNDKISVLVKLFEDKPFNVWRNRRFVRTDPRKMADQYIEFTRPAIWQQACRWADNMKRCSCYCCGNPRHNEWDKEKYRITMQERKAYDSYLAQVKDLEDKYRLPR